MTPETLETALVSRIETLSIPALPYPENPKNYYPENSPGEVLVRYEGRKVVERDVTGHRNVLKHFIEIVVVTRQVRGDGGAYAWLESIYQALEGFTLDFATGPLRLEVESFMDENNGTWQFGQKWSCETLEYIELTDNYGEDNLGDN